MPYEPIVMRHGHCKAYNKGQVHQDKFRCLDENRGHIISTTIALSRNGEVVDDGGRVPVGIQVVVGAWEWSRSGPELVENSREVLRVSGDSCINVGNGNASDFNFLPSLPFICLEYLVEGLFGTPQSPTADYNVGFRSWAHLMVSLDGEGPVLQLIGGESRQNVGKISRNITP